MVVVVVAVVSSSSAVIVKNVKGIQLSCPGHRHKGLYIYIYIYKGIIILLIIDVCTEMEVFSFTHRPLFPREKAPVSTGYEAGWGS